MGKYTKKRNCHKNKSMKKMKKGGGDPKNDNVINGNKTDIVREAEPTGSTTGAPVASSEAQVAPSGSTKPASWFSSFTSMFSSNKTNNTNNTNNKTGGKKNKQKRNKSKK